MPEDALAAVSEAADDASAAASEAAVASELHSDNAAAHQDQCGLALY